MADQTEQDSTQNNTALTVPDVELLPASVADEVLNQVVAKINGITRQATLEHALAVGQVIIEDLYGGDREAWRSRGTKDTSFRKLAEREDLDMGRATLQRSVAAYVLVQDLGIDVSTWRHLGLSHVRAVLGLPEDKQRKLLTSAEEKGWTVHQIEAKVSKLREKDSDGRGRPPLPAFVKGISRIRKLVEDRTLLFGDLDKIDELDPDEVMDLTEKIAEIMRACASLQEKIQNRVQGTTKQPVEE